MIKERWRLLVAIAATVAVIAPLAWLWQASRMPGEYSVMDMGYADYGGGPVTDSHSGDEGGHAGHGGDSGDHASEDPGTTSVVDLVDDLDRTADVTVDLVAEAGTITLASGREVEGYTLNGTSPGPMIRVREGQLLEVRLRNESVEGGVTLHWHGVDVPNAEDGVAGVTQDAVGMGEEHTYRWVADDAGTYWYHSHQVSHEQVVRGLLGPLVVEQRKPDAEVVEVPALAHTYSGRRTINGEEGDVPVVVEAGRQVRVRVINTDNGPVRTWADAPYTVAAVDARDLNEPTPVSDRWLTVTAGGRADLLLDVPEDGSALRVQVGTATALVIGPEGSEAPAVPEPDEGLDLLSYGSPAPLGFDPEDADRDFDYSIGRRPGFVQGKPGLWWTINGHMWPNVPMFMVAEGDVVRMTIDNHSGDVHPMHLHGHHAVVLSRNGVESTGSPWWVDSLDVRDGEEYEIAFVADNPGVWMDHCHNLQHAVDGLIAHLMYEGVTTPYRIGGKAENHPE